MPEEVVKYRAANAIATITLNRPEKANTLRLEVIDGLDSCLAQANRDTEVKVILLEGTGPRPVRRGGHPGGHCPANQRIVHGAPASHP